MDIKLGTLAAGCGRARKGSEFDLRQTYRLQPTAAAAAGDDLGDAQPAFGDAKEGGEVAGEVVRVEEVGLGRKMEKRASERTGRQRGWRWEMGKVGIEEEEEEEEREQESRADEQEAKRGGDSRAGEDQDSLGQAQCRG